MIDVDSKEIEARLAEAAAGMRECEIVGQRYEQLHRNIAVQRAALEKLHREYERELGDVLRLERLSMTRVIASLRGSREQSLEREKAEADAVAYRVLDATDQLDEMVRELEQTDVRLARLSLSREAYAAAQADKEQFLIGTKDHRGGKLVELAEAKGRLKAELKEVDEAITTAEVARRALVRVAGLLDSASGWSTYDTFLGGGAISSAIKHDRLDEAAEAAARADRALARLRTELADVPGELSVSGLNFEGMTRFVDIWLDNIFVDLAVRERIKSAQANVDRATRRVDRVLDRLSQRRSGGHSKLVAMAAERQRLLA